MDPAMDRSPGLDLGRTRVALGLGLCLVPILTFSGCARMRTSRSAPTPATLGVERPDNNYSSYHTARVTKPAGVGDPAPPQFAGIEQPLPGDMMASDAPSVEVAPPVAQAPGQTTPNADPSDRLVSASQGVPNASRLLASTPPRGGTESVKERTAEQMILDSRAALEQAATYQAAMHRQERVGSNLLPAEDLIISVRKDPKAVRLSWPEGPHKGREAIYRADAGDAMMHVNMADSPFPVPRIALAPNSPLVMKNSRHPITEAGFDSILVDLENALRSPASATLASLGWSTPAPLDRPHLGLVRTNAAGETAQVYFDPDTHLPALVEVKTAQGDILEHYVFRDVKLDVPELAQAEAFDQDARWGPSRGLFGRVARGTSKADGDTTPR